MEGCEKRECKYCVTVDEDRIEYCIFYDMPCYAVERCHWSNKHKTLMSENND